MCKHNNLKTRVSLSIAKVVMTMILAAVRGGKNLQKNRNLRIRICRSYQTGRSAEVFSVDQGYVCMALCQLCAISGLSA